MLCNCCNCEKEETEFTFRKDRGTYRKTCKACNTARAKNRYHQRKATNPFIYKHQKQRVVAQQKGLPYDLTPEFLKGIWTGFCPISGDEIFLPTNEGDRGKPDSAELDRFIPELGYTKGNVSWISRKYNVRKQNSTLEELKKIVAWMETYEPVKEAYAEIEKPKQAAWNKGLKMDKTNTNGEKNSNSVLTEDQVRCIIKEYDGQRGQIKRLANSYNVSTTTISKIVKRETWKHIA
jgi:hypothetical protein